METQVSTSRLETRPDHLGSSATWASKRATHPQEKQRSRKTQTPHLQHQSHPTRTSHPTGQQQGRPRATQRLVQATETVMALEVHTLVQAAHPSTSNIPAARISSVQTVGQPPHLSGVVTAAATLFATPAVFILNYTMSIDL